MSVKEKPVPIPNRPVTWLYIFVNRACAAILHKKFYDRSQVSHLSRDIAVDEQPHLRNAFAPVCPFTKAAIYTVSAKIDTYLPNLPGLDKNGALPS